MPKLSADAINEKKSHIEQAARELFIKNGFHATSMRDIAKSAGVSLGNLYNYYSTKDELFESIVAKYLKVIDRALREMFASIEEPLERESLKRLGEMAGELVNKYSDFWLLMYIDVLEFQNRHFRKMFDGLAERFERLFEKQFREAGKRGDLRAGIKPAAVFTAAYMQFFNYFLVEKLFGGNGHLGLDDRKVIECISDIFAFGALSEAKLKTQAKKNSRTNNYKNKK
jgi:AcrR family transcriptional regulator